MARPADFDQHVREIIQAAEGGHVQRDPNVISSWLRCLHDHKLDPEHRGEAHILPQDQLHHHQQESEEFLRMARCGMEDLYRRVKSMGYVLLLSDAKGVTVDFIGNDRVDKELKRAGLYLGSEWNEESAGTCGVGACLASGESITIHQTDHFDMAHTPLSCTAAPIYNALGQLQGVMDASLMVSPIEKRSQDLVLEVVKSCVRRIELANLISNHRMDWIVRIGRSPEFLEVDPRCAFSVTPDGLISGMTHKASFMLARILGTDVKNPQYLIDRPFEDIFNHKISDLPSLRQENGEQVVETRDGEIILANALAPSMPRKLKTSKALPEPLIKIHGGDPKMQQLAKKASKVLNKQISVILYGETGVGKEFVAKAMHFTSRKKGAFVAINCAGLPESLIESELFGYSPNSFTGAHARGKKGLIEQANGGTLFLDEIGDMPLVLQGRLLRVLAEREVMPLGGSKTVPINIRVISASHRNLQKLVEVGQFRQDLYYRLNGVMLEIPPVRERLDFDWLLRQVTATKETGPLEFSEAAMIVLKNHDWPGNVRELINVCELCAALHEGGIVEPAHLRDLIQGSAVDPSPSIGNGNISQTREELITLLLTCRWNISLAARKMGVDRTTMYRRMKRYGVVSPNHASESIQSS